MSKQNYMEEIAKVLGLKIGERFHIVGVSDNPYYLTEDGVVDGKNQPCVVLESILTGRLEIRKLSWIPQDGDSYWYINTYGQVLEAYWFARIDNDWERLKIGNCFPTKQLATENVENFLAYIKGEPDFSWRKK